MKVLSLLFVVMLFALACGGAATPAADPTTSFDPSGLKLVIGVDRTKTIEVKPSGDVVSSDTGHTTMKFVGRELQLADGSKTILTLDGDTLRGPTKTAGTFEGDALALGDARISVDDDGTVKLERSGSSRKMRMHFDGPVVGHRRAAVMLVMVVFSLYVATNPNATLDRFLDD